MLYIYTHTLQNIINTNNNQVDYLNLYMLMLSLLIIYIIFFNCN